MERPLRPSPQEIYRHFKGNLYQIVTVATHSETREEMVVYQALYGDYKIYVRPLDMFMSKVDRVKYPNAVQEYRFEKVSPSKEVSVKELNDTSSFETPSGKRTFEQAREDFRKEPYKPSQVMAKTADEEASELNLDPLVIKFLDADLAAEKNDILSKLRPIITNDMIDIMAMSLGVVVEKGDVYDRFNDLRTCLSAIEKFESSRLRS